MRTCLSILATCATCAALACSGETAEVDAGVVAAVDAGGDIPSMIQAAIDRAGCRLLGDAKSVTASGAHLELALSGEGASTIEVSLDGQFTGTETTPFVAPAQTIDVELPPAPDDYPADGALVPTTTISVRFSEGATHVDRVLFVRRAPQGWFVSADAGDDASPDGSAQCPYRSISQAVATACAAGGGKVFASAGEYLENIVFPEGCRGVSLLGAVSPDLSNRKVGGCGKNDYRTITDRFDTVLLPASEHDLTARNNRWRTSFAYAGGTSDVPASDRWWVGMILPSSIDETTRIDGLHFRSASTATAGAQLFLDSALDPGTDAAHPTISNNFFEVADDRGVGVWISYRNAGEAARAPVVNPGPKISCNTILGAREGGVFITRQDDSSSTGEQWYAADITDNAFETITPHGKGIQHTAPRIALTGAIAGNELRASAPSSYGIWSGLSVVLDGGAVPFFRGRIADNLFLVTGNAASAPNSSGRFVEHSIGLSIGGPFGPILPIRAFDYGEISGNTFDVRGETAWGAQINVSSDAAHRASIHDNTFITAHAFRDTSDAFGNRIENLALWISRTGNIDAAEDYVARVERNTFVGPGEIGIRLTSTTNRPVLIAQNMITNFRYGFLRGLLNTGGGNAELTRNFFAEVQYGVWEDSHSGGSASLYANNVIAATFSALPGSSGEKIGISCSEGSSTIVNNTVWLANEAPGTVSTHGIYTHEDLLGAFVPIIVNNLLLADGNGGVGLREFANVDGGGAEFLEVRSNVIFGFRTAYHDGRDGGCGPRATDFDNGADINLNATCSDQASDNLAGIDLLGVTITDLVTDPNAHDFTLPPGSRARGVGWDVNDSFVYGPVTEDYLGTPRPDMPSAGAYE